MLNSTQLEDNQHNSSDEIQAGQKPPNHYQHNDTTKKHCHWQFICMAFVITFNLILLVRIYSKMQKVDDIKTQMTKKMDVFQQIATKQNIKQIKLKIENIETQMVKFQQIETKQDTKDIRLKVDNIKTQMTNIEQKLIKQQIQRPTFQPYTQQIFDPNSYKYDISKLQNPMRIIQVTYGPGEFSKMPLNNLQTNKEGKKIQDVLYPNQEMRKQRIQFEKHRRDVIKLNAAKFEQLYLIEFNNPLNVETQNRGIIENEKQWLRMQQNYSLSKITKELPFCIIVPGYNNNASFRIEHNLNSVFMQNYSNYKVVIIDDSSTDGSVQIYKKYLQFYKIDKRYYTLISTTKKVTALPNHYFGTMLHCTKDSIVLHLDADDQLIGRNSIKLFNWAYQTKKAGVIYSSYYRYTPPNKIAVGFTSPYSQYQKKNSLYRNYSGSRFSHLRSFRVQLLYQIDPSYFMDSDGKFYTLTYDSALFYPLMEVSCGRVQQIQNEFNYLYNYGTGLNDMITEPKRQKAINTQIKKKKGLNCWKDFDQRMKK